MSKDKKKYSVQIRRWKQAKFFKNWTKKQLYSREMFATNLAFQEEDFIFEGS